MNDDSLSENAEFLYRIHSHINVIISFSFFFFLSCSFLLNLMIRISLSFINFAFVLCKTFSCKHSYGIQKTYSLKTPFFSITIAKGQNLKEAM